jgi:iron-sulfur cluster assembly protein
MLELTERAVAAVKRVLAAADNDILGLRIMAASSGCAGLQYHMGLEVAARDDDEIVECAGVKLFVDAESRFWLTGTEIDFLDEPPDSGFVFRNPNAGTGCSCGKPCPGGRGDGAC